ncbi:MAG TPA: phage holin family protein [Candidatus Omnitrophota bacterium]|nr:phage holin family protein [Candidatus Omnitrophota bacterium]HPD84524.1 phage holin family protein [Candidatus Omnitrophota bacterium]HRZ03382.1 phage holin family protein [Candidatus Omnitrophota bacterium]
MIDFLIRWVVNTFALLIVVRLVPGIQAAQWETVAVAALVLGMLNAFLKPLLILFTLPFNVLSLGLLTFLINGLLFYSVSKIVEGFHIVDFWTAFWGSILFSIVSFILSLFVGAPMQKMNVRFYKDRPFPDMDDSDVIDVEGKSTDDEDENKRISDDR